MKGPWAIVVVGVLGAGCGRIDFDRLLDTGAGSEAVPVDARPRRMYAVSAITLYQIDPVTLQPTRVVDLCGPAVANTVADVAVDSTGQVVISETGASALYRIDLGTGACAMVPLSIGGFGQYGAEFVPAGVLGPVEVLAVAGSNGELYAVDAVTGLVTDIGPMHVVPSGDLAWTGSELLLTASTGGADDLASLDPTTGAATLRGSTTYAQVLGLAWLDGTLYGFTGGQMALVLDPATGAATRVQANGQSWFGAASGP